MHECTGTRIQTHAHRTPLKHTLCDYERQTGEIARAHHHPSSSLSSPYHIYTLTCICCLHLLTLAKGWIYFEIGRVNQLSYPCKMLLYNLCTTTTTTTSYYLPATITMRQHEAV